MKFKSFKDFLKEETTSADIATVDTKLGITTKVKKRKKPKEKYEKV